MGGHKPRVVFCWNTGHRSRHLQATGPHPLLLAVTALPRSKSCGCCAHFELEDGEKTRFSGTTRCPPRPCSTGSSGPVPWSHPNVYCACICVAWLRLGCVFFFLCLFVCFLVCLFLSLLVSLFLCLFVCFCFSLFVCMLVCVYVCWCAFAFVCCAFVCSVFLPLSVPHFLCVFCVTAVTFLFSFFHLRS